MVAIFQTKLFRVGALGTALVLSGALCACDGEKKNANKVLSDKHVFNATVREITGDAKIIIDDEAYSLSVGQNVFEKTQLETGVASSVVLSVADGSALKVDGKSAIQFDVTIESLKRTMSVALHQGRLMFDVQKQAIKDEFEISTEHGKSSSHKLPSLDEVKILLCTITAFT